MDKQIELISDGDGLAIGAISAGTAGVETAKHLGSKTASRARSVGGSLSRGISERVQRRREPRGILDEE